MRPLRALLALLALPGVVSLGGRAAADQPPPTVVVLVESSESPLSQRLKQEMESLGLSVQWGDPTLAPTRPLEVEARSAGAIAAVRVTQLGGGAVEMTILDRVTGKTVHRALSVSTPSDPAAAELIATRTVELLRASLMELASPHPPRGEVPATPEVRALAPRPPEPFSRTPRQRSGVFSLQLGPALVYSPDWRPAGHLSMGAGWMPTPLVGIEGWVLVPVIHSRVVDEEGYAELAASLYGLGGVFRWQTKSSLSARATAGVALGVLEFEGVPNSPYEGARDRLWAWSPYAGGGMVWQVLPGFGVRLDLSAGLAYPHTVVRFAMREIADWGRPWCAGSLAAELSLPR
jgi:hypothetical protein